MSSVFTTPGDVGPVAEYDVGKLIVANFSKDFLGTNHAH